MKKILILIVLIGFNNFSKSQSIEVKNAEENLLHLFNRKLSLKLNTVEFSKKPFRRLYYYGYKLSESDSLIWNSYNDQNLIMDSLAKDCMRKSIDSISKLGNKRLIKNESITYIPVIIFYNNVTEKDFYNDSVSIGPMFDLFGFGKDENFNAEPIFRITKPLKIVLPKQKPYLKIKQE